MVLFDNNKYNNVGYYHSTQLLKKNEIARFNTSTNTSYINKLNESIELQSITESSIKHDSKTSNLQRDFKTSQNYKRDIG
jgi:hypothetical protein